MIRYVRIIPDIPFLGNISLQTKNNGGGSQITIEKGTNGRFTHGNLRTFKKLLGYNCSLQRR
jgi:hypothetical protein